MAISTVYQIPCWYLMILFICGSMSTIALLKIATENLLDLDSRLTINFYGSLLGILLVVLMDIGNRCLIVIFGFDYRSRSSFFCGCAMLISKFFQYFIIYNHLTLNMINFLVIRKFKVGASKIWMMWVVVNLLLGILAYPSLVEATVEGSGSDRYCDVSSNVVTLVDTTAQLFVPLIVILVITIPCFAVDNGPAYFPVFMGRFLFKINVIFIITHSPMFVLNTHNLIYGYSSNKDFEYQGFSEGLALTFYSFYSMIGFAMNPHLISKLLSSVFKAKGSELKRLHGTSTRADMKYKKENCIKYVHEVRKNVKNRGDDTQSPPCNVDFHQNLRLSSSPSDTAKETGCFTALEMTLSLSVITDEPSLPHQGGSKDVGHLNERGD